MNTAKLDHLLRQTLADHSLRTAERRALDDWIDQHANSDQDRALARSRAFAIARETMASDSNSVLAWLEDVIRIMARPVPSAHPPVESAAAYFSPGTTCIQEIIRQFNLARDTCDVCVFTITDDRITSSIIRAHDRGVKLRVVTDDAKAHDLGSDIERLIAAGIPCKMDLGQAAHMHHKFALFDGRRLMSGSFNWTRSASEQNEENLIVTSDPVLVHAFADRFERLWDRMKQ